jgi:DNA-binding PadR family transcriptional regulator
MASYSKELLKGAADTLVLSAFAEGESTATRWSGAGEAQRGVLCLKEGTLYPILHRLESRDC